MRILRFILFLSISAPAVLHWSCSQSTPSSPAPAPVTLVIIQETSTPSVPTNTPTPILGGGYAWSRVLADNASPPSTQFSERNMAGAVSFNGALWLVGGYGSAIRNDVWKSTDGVNWTNILPNNASPASSQFTQRAAQTVLAYNGALWVIAGTGGGNLNDVWNSTDGITWTRVLANNASPGPGQFSQRWLHASVVFNGLMWVIGGGGSTLYNDVWASADGATWTQVSANAGFPYRSGLSAAAYNGNLFITGGYIGGVSDLNDVWESSNGATWSNILTDNASPGPGQFTRREGQTLSIYNNALWLIGGQNRTPTFFNDVWTSTDGISWFQPVASTPFSARAYHSSAVFNGFLWIIGGDTTGYAILNDVWHTP